MKLKTKITVSVTALMIAVLLIVSVVTGTLMFSVSKTKSIETVNANISDLSNQLDSWLMLESQKVSDLAYMFQEADYAGTKRNDMENALVKGLSEIPEFYAMYIGCEDNFARFSDGWIPDADYIITDRDWYKAAKENSKQAIITDPYIDVGTGRMVITVAKAMIDSNNNVSGVFAADIFIDELQEINSSFNSMEGGSPVLISNEGVIISHENAEYLPSIDSEGNEVYTHYDDIIREVGNVEIAKNGNKSYICCGQDGVQRYTIEMPIESAGWTLCYGLDTSVLYKDINKMLLMLIIIIPCMIVFAIIALTFVLKSCFKPLSIIEAKARKLADGDLSIKFDYDVDDEIGTVCRIIEDTNQTIKTYVNDITEQLQKMQNGDFSEVSSLEYKGDFKPILTAFEKINSALNRAFNGISNATDVVFANADNFSQSANNLAESSTIQASIVEEINNDVMVTTDEIKQTLELTTSAKKIAESTQSTVEKSNEHMKCLINAMKEIEKASTEISSMNKVIEDIAFQTNILALNASVEAARAGAAGKGFAVVADEVRNLAGKSAETSRKTTELINRSSLAVNNGLDYTELTAKSLNIVQEETTKVVEIISNIAEKALEQSYNIENISEKTEKVSDQVMMLAASAEESASSSVELNNQANDLKTLLKRFKLK